jgi:hypothetical protein
VQDQDGRQENNNSSKSPQFVATSGTGITTVKEKRPNWVGKLTTEAKRERSHGIWAKRQR